MYRQAPYVTFKDLEAEFRRKDEKVLLQNKKFASSNLKANLKKSGKYKVTESDKTEGYLKIKELLDNPPNHVVSLSHTALTGSEMIELRKNKNLDVSRYNTVYSPT